MEIELNCPVCRQYSNYSLKLYFSSDRFPDCPICLESNADQALDCGHVFCETCISEINNVNDTTWDEELDYDPYDYIERPSFDG